MRRRRDTFYIFFHCRRDRVRCVRLWVRRAGRVWRPIRRLCWYEAVAVVDRNPASGQGVVRLPADRGVPVLATAAESARPKESAGIADPFAAARTRAGAAPARWR